MSRISVMPSGVSVAGLGGRFVAAVIDGLPFAVIAAAAGLLMTARQPPQVVLVVGIGAGVLALAWALFVWWGYATRGAGPGAKAMGILVLGLRDGQPIGWGRYFLRELVWAASAAFVVPWIVMVVMMVTHQRRQGWHDLAAKCVAVKRARALESGGSVARASVQSANTVALPPHLAGTSFAGPAIPSADELPSSAGYTPTALGSAQPAGPIASVPGSFAPAVQPAVPFQPPPSYQPATQPKPFPSAMPGQPQSFPSAAPAQPQSAVPWNQWGAQPPAAAPAQPYPGQPYPGQPYPGQPYPGQPGPYRSGPADYAPAAAPVQPQPGFAPQQPPPGPGSAAPAADDYESTHLASRSAGPAQRGAAEGWQARLDDGRVIDVDGLVLIGRNPVARPDETASQLVSAGAGSRMVSKTHLALATDQRGLYVSDRGSTNGTAIAAADGAFEPCAPGDKVRLREGQVVSFGDRYLEVRRTH